MLQRSYFCVWALVVFFTACSSRVDMPLETQLHSMLPSQQIADYISTPYGITAQQKESLKQDYLAHYKSPLNVGPKIDIDTATWALKSARVNSGFGENHLVNSLEWIDFLEEEADFSHFPSVQEVAVVTETTNVRGLPTNKPRFFNPKLAGEGHPFDYWQNSLIFANTPVLITHYSKSREWAFIESGFVSGFVQVTKLAKLTPKDREFLEQTQDFIVVLQDKTPIYNSHGGFLHQARVGMFYPLLRKDTESFTVAVFSRSIEGFAIRGEVVLPLINHRDNGGFKESFGLFPLDFSQQNLALLAQPIVGEKYGWGGVYENRDCSAFLRDILGNFGFWLPRNSKAQMTFDNAFISMSGLTRKEKLEMLRNRGIPFLTLLGMNGHIMLYIGMKNTSERLDTRGNSFFILHDVWGVRTQKDGSSGRAILGGVVITPINFGEGISDKAEYVDNQSLFIERIDSMKNLVHF